MSVSLFSQRWQHIPTPAWEILQLHLRLHSQEQHWALSAAGGDSRGNEVRQMCSWCIQDPIVRLVENWVWYMNNVSSVWQVIESSKRWWKCRNRFNQIGFVPFNILEPMAHIDSPVTSRPPSVRHKNTHTQITQAQRYAIAWTYLNSSVVCSLRSAFLQVSAPPPLTKTNSAVPPSPPAPPPSHSPQRPRSLHAYSQHIPAVDDTENKGTNVCVFV